MGQGKSKKTSPPLPADMLDMYIRSEFQAMDSDNDGKLTRKEVRDLLVLLGFKNSKSKLKALHVNSRKDTVSLEEYLAAFKADPPMIEKTDRFRQLFKLFDKNSDGWATKQEVISGLEEVDITVDKALRETVEKMDANSDGRVSYEEFLVTEFRIALRLKEEDKNKSMFEED